MSLDKGTLTRHPWARISGIGSPWHGLVKNSRLPLSNGSELIYPQPTGTPDQSGNTHRVQVPDRPPVTRTPAQAARDAEVGAQWRNQAMLSGAGLQLFGQTLNGWIYIDDNKDRWWVTASGMGGATIDLSASLSITVTLRRFGVFSATPDTTVHTHTATLTNLEQSGTLTVNGVNVTNAGMFIHAIQPQGQAVAIMLARSAGATLPSIDPMHRYPVGYLQLSISGPGNAASVSLTVLRSRAQTFVATGDPVPPVPAANYLGGDIEWSGGEQSFLVESGVDPFPPAGVTEPWTANTFQLTSYSYSVSGSSRYILGLFPTGSSWLELAHEIQWSESVTASSPAKIGDLPCVVTMSDTVTATAAIKITIGGATVFSSQASSSIDNTQTATVAASTFTTVDLYREWSATLNGHVRSGTISSSSLIDNANVTAGSAPLVGVSPRPTRSVVSAQIVQGASIDAVNAAGVSEIHEYILMRYSNNCLGICDYSYGAVPSTYTYRAPITPDGASPDAPVVSAANPYVTQFYGSWCPHTGAVSWLQNTPVCWV